MVIYNPIIFPGNMSSWSSKDLPKNYDKLSESHKGQIAQMNSKVREVTARELEVARVSRYSKNQSIKTVLSREQSQGGLIGCVQTVVGWSKKNKNILIMAFNSETKFLNHTEDLPFSF